MNIIAIIPARMASTRLPGKPMKPICGMPMVGHVYARAKMSEKLTGVYIATCDQEIMDYAGSIGAPAYMTSDTHERCTDRVAEAMAYVERDTGEEADIVLVLQGDEPMTTPEMIDAALAPMMDDPSIDVVNLMAPLASAKEHDDKNEPKVVVDKQGNAMYMSREAIPSRWKQGEDVPMMKQVCVMPFRRQALLDFNAMEQTPCEIAESIDMLRLLENGKPVRMVLSPTAATYSVDTPEDLAHVEQAMRDDPLVVQYAA